MPKNGKTAPRRPKKRGVPASPKVRAEMVAHEFTLVYRGSLVDLSDADVDALYEAGCSDALVGSSAGEITIDFGRKAPSFRAALLSAILDVDRSGLGLDLLRVDPI